MVDQEDFRGMCERLARVTGRIDEETRKIYFEQLRGFDRDILAKAMRRVGREHGFYKFPTIGEITDAIKDSHEGRRPTPEYCDVCNRTGMVLVEKDKHSSVYACACQNGRILGRRLRSFSEVEGLFDPPAPIPRPVVPFAGLEAIHDGMVFPDGAVVEKTCGYCWDEYRYEHTMPLTGKMLKEIHLGRIPQCHRCYIEEGVKRGIWKKPQETAGSGDSTSRSF